jgi:hypothetical protein
MATSRSKISFQHGQHPTAREVALSIFAALGRTFAPGDAFRRLKRSQSASDAFAGTESPVPTEHQKRRRSLVRTLPACAGSTGRLRYSITWHRRNILQWAVPGCRRPVRICDNPDTPFAAAAGPLQPLVERLTASGARTPYSPDTAHRISVPGTALLSV